jgi:hypothetical protein
VGGRNNKHKPVEWKPVHHCPTLDGLLITTDGQHGSRALWEKYPDNDACRNAVQAFSE